MAKLSCDVLVVGAGPAGSTAARVAAQEGAQVILVDRKAQIGVPEQCAGYVSQAIHWHVHLPRPTVAQRVDRLVAFLPDGTCHQAEVSGYILNRAALDRHLALEAVKAGAQLSIRTGVVGQKEAGIVAQREGRELIIEASVVIGADGPHSLVGRWMGQAPLALARARQYEVALRQPLSAARVYFRPPFRGGYAWLFPRGETAWVGAASTGGEPELSDGFYCLLGELVREGVAARSALSFAAGFVPLGQVSRLVQGNLMLVGDAAGQPHPITGAGIINAIIGGEMAGRAAARAALMGHLGLLKEYAEEWQEVMGPALERAEKKRRLLEEGWGSSPQELSKIIRQSWIAFDEYYQEAAE